MNKVKTVFWALVLGFILLVFFQNQNFFMIKQSLRLNLLFWKYQAPEVYTAIIFLVCFAAGLILSYFLSLSERVKFKKTIKNLNATVDSQMEKISAIKKENEQLKGRSSAIK